MFSFSGSFRVAARSIAIRKLSAPVKRSGGNPLESLETFFYEAGRVDRMKIYFSKEESAEHARIGNEYNRQSALRRNKMKKDVATKAWLMTEAISALPKNLVAAALIPPGLPPFDRPWIEYDTPPIRGFKPENYLDEDALKLADRDKL